MNPQEGSPELEALTLLTTESNEKLEGIQAASEASAQQLTTLNEIAENQETQIVQADNNTQKLVEPLNKIAETLTRAEKIPERFSKFLDEFKGEKGDKGDSPSDDEIIKLIKPLIPKPIKGDKGDPGKDAKPPTEQEILALIKPLIPEPIKGKDGKDGKTPDDEKLLSLIRPLIPAPIKGDRGQDADTTAVIKTVTQTLTKKLSEDTERIARHVSSKSYHLNDLVDVQADEPNTNATIQYQPNTGVWQRGVSITVSTTAPTDPKFGDLWFDIS